MGSEIVVLLVLLGGAAAIWGSLEASRVRRLSLARLETLAVSEADGEFEEVRILEPVERIR
jgi:hypothetical protein